MSTKSLSPLVDEVVLAVLQLRPEADVFGTHDRVLIRNASGDLVVRLFSRDPEVDVSFEVETWGTQISAEASFSNMPADVIAAAIVSALKLGF